MRRVPIWFSLFWVVVVPGSTADAQEERTGCDYEACALELSEWQVGWRVVRGPKHVGVIPRDIWISDLAPVFDGSPEAQALAERYRRMQNTGAVLTILGITMVAVPSVFRGGRPEMGWGLLGAGLLGLGAYRVIGAQDHLLEAIEVYNAALRAREGRTHETDSGR